MLQMFKVWGLVGAFLLSLGPVLAQAAQAAPAAPGRLVSASWLQQHLGRPDVLVLDASPPRLHQQQHIPGAIPAPLFTMGPHELPQAEVQARLQAWGIGTHQRIVILDQGGTYIAARLFWDLLHHGLPAERLHLLDGGMAKWVASGGAVTTEPTPMPAPGAVRLAAPDHSVRVQLPEFLAATGDPQHQVMLEALDPEYFFGGAAFFNRAGHVPHATLMPANDFYNADKTFKSPAEIQRMVHHLGIRADQQVHTYCGGGGAAAVPFFALKFMLGYPQVKLFRESQLAWLQDERELPVWTYAVPRLLRDSAWLKPWNSPMLRAFGLAQVSIVDVRPAEAYRLGHLPHAVNLPASVFQQHLHDLPGLAALLDRAGVDRSHEAVVFSEGGVNPASALAFWMLERVGQRKVSVFTDHIEGWAELGHEVARTPDSAPPAATATAAAPAISTATATPVPRLITGDLPPAGADPRVLVASGPLPPSSPPAAQVLQIAPDQLLNAGGAPKAAKDLWQVLAKAGLPRYAEVVLLADTQGTAAMNYVVLRLMGFPNLVLWAP